MDRLCTAYFNEDGETLDMHPTATGFRVVEGDILLYQGEKFKVLHCYVELRSFKTTNLHVIVRKNTEVD